MRMLAAAILAVGALTAPAAIGQSQGIVAGTPEAVQLQPVAAPSYLPNPQLRDFDTASRSFDAGSVGPTGPESAFSWVMALAFLGFVVLRRTRGL